MPHVDDARLHAYLDGELRWLGEDPAVLEHHLEGCAGCRARLEEAKRLREQARSLLGSYLPVERPPFETVLERARGGVGSAVRRRVPAAVWAASLVLALAGGWLGRGLVSVGDPASGGERVRVSSAPVPAHPAATTEADTAAGRRPPGAAEAERTPASAPIVEAGVPRTAKAEPLAAPIPPVVQRVESAPLAARAPSVSDEGGRIRMIEGRVTDESGRVIRGAVVQVRGLGVGTLTGPDGSYSLAMPEGRTGGDDGLVITATALGWESATEPLSSAGDRALTRDFRLRPAQVALEAMVAVGYGSDNRALRDAEISETEGAAGWAHAEREEIRRLLGRDALRIAGMQVLETAIGRVDGMRTVRIRQELPGGTVATLLQWAEPRGGDAVTAAVTVTSRSPLRGSPNGAEAEATAWRDGVRIVARAPLAAESLARLLERLD